MFCKLKNKMFLRCDCAPQSSNKYMANVTVYSTPSCGYCKMEKEFLAEKGVDFVEIDVAADQEAAAQMVEKTGQMGVPVTIVALDNGTEEILVGFDQERLVELLNLA